MFSKSDFSSFFSSFFGSLITAETSFSGNISSDLVFLSSLSDKSEVSPVQNKSVINFSVSSVHEAVEVEFTDSSAEEDS